jgi:hypothetical protein
MSLASVLIKPVQAFKATKTLAPKVAKSIMKAPKAIATGVKNTVKTAMRGKRIAKQVFHIGADLAGHKAKGKIMGEKH